MIGETAAYTGADNINNAFESVADGNPYFSLWKGREIITQNTSPDFDKAKKRLEDWLLALQQAGSTDLYTIKLHPSLKSKGDKDLYITVKSPVIGSMKVRVCPLGSEAGMLSGFSGNERPGDMPNAVWYMLKGIKDGVDANATTNAELTQRVLDLESGAVGAVADEADVWDKISKLLDKPVASQIVSQLLPVITGILKPQNNMIVNGVDNTANSANNSDTAVPANIANNSDGGSDEAEIWFNGLTDMQAHLIDASIYRLSKHTDDVVRDLGLLAIFAENNPVMFKSLLANLKG